MTAEFWLIVWAILASMVLCVDRYRISKLEDENDRLWCIVNLTKLGTAARAIRNKDMQQ